MQLIDFSGVLDYSIVDGEHRCVLNLDQNLVRMYYSLIPKCLNVKSQAHRAHLTVCRIGKEVPKNLDVWGKYHGKTIDLKYMSWVRNDERYYWIDAFSYGLENIREELGLIVPSLTKPILDYKRTFHITIGNVK